MIYRICNWIPEKMLVSDVGNEQVSYDKLKETFVAGNLLLFWEEAQTNLIRPILDFQTDTASGKRCIKTIDRMKPESQFVLREWDELYTQN